jgi:hypothetical protein
LPCSKILPILDEMPKPKTISMRELLTKAERIATDIDSSGTIYRIKRRGHKTLVLIDECELQLLEESIDFMFENPHWQEEFVRLAQIGRAQLGDSARRGITLDEYLRKRRLDADGRPLPDRRIAIRRTSRNRTAKAAGRAARTRARAS